MFRKEFEEKVATKKYNVDSAEPVLVRIIQDKEAMIQRLMKAQQVASIDQ